MHRQLTFCFIVSLIISGCGYSLASQQVADWSLFMVGMALTAWTILAHFTRGLKPNSGSQSSKLSLNRSHS